MKIGIVTSGNDMLTLFKFLNTYDHEYMIYYDQVGWPYGDKDISFVQKRTHQAIDFLVSKGCEKIIVSPIVEMSLNHDAILPLFKHYLSEYCFKYSLVGKIGLVGDFADMCMAQQVIEEYATGYTPTDIQKKIKRFTFPFDFWKKEVGMWKYFFTTLSYSHYLVNKVIKFDLRYFKDAGVDTIIPLNYGYFNFQTTIGKYFNFKKQRFHKLDKLETCFAQISLDISLSTPTTYSVTICTNGTDVLLRREKKMMWLLERGKSINIQRQQIV